jgi:Ca2+-binding RTX toxin-like protein
MDSSIQRPRARGRRIRFLVAAVAATATSLAFAAPALAESCVYDAGTKTVAATITPGSEATLKVVGNELYFGLLPAPCLGATTANVDSIAIAGASGSTERLTLDERDGVFGPGFTAESNVPEIEIATTLGDATDTVVVYGTEGDDTISPGQFGLSFNIDGDVDVTFAPSAFPMEIHVGGGSDYVNGRGQGGAGLHFLGPLTITGGEGDDVLLRGSSEPDSITGGPGNDRIDAQDSPDVVDGGTGNDVISSGGGSDDVTGGPGADSFAGSDGDDVFHADDGEADTLLSGGPGVDTAYYESALDAAPTAIEILNPSGPPPPPPSGPCTYNSATRTVTAQVTAGADVALKVVGTEIWFGSPLAVCPDATTANTDTINVSGPAGSTERLTVDQTGGVFGPGATAEGAGTSEIEIAVLLGDAGDVITVLGTTGDDSIFAGVNGVSLNADGDRDVSFATAPAALEIRGLGGRNTITGRGGSGAGAGFPGVLNLYAGDLGDSLTGGLGNDTLNGGAGADVLNGREGNDVLLGGDANDLLNGGDGGDQLTGGAGADGLSGGAGDDTTHADDDFADTSINGGPGIDTAFYDAGTDPLPVATENRIPA